IKIVLGYDGSGFSGWAAQPGRRTVQAVLSEALGQVLRLPDAAEVTVAGRTDAGVHARGQVAHFDVPAQWWAADGHRLVRRLDWRRDDCGVVVASVVADAFCHNMVRALMGALIPVGEGRRAVDWPLRVLEAGIRDPGVRVMSAHGLCLEEVGYPPDDELAAR